MNNTYQKIRNATINTLVGVTMAASTLVVATGIGKAIYQNFSKPGIHGEYQGYATRAGWNYDGLKFVLLHGENSLIGTVGAVDINKNGTFQEDELIHTYENTPLKKFENIKCLEDAFNKVISPYDIDNLVLP